MSVGGGSITTPGAGTFGGGSISSIGQPGQVGGGTASISASGGRSSSRGTRRIPGASLVKIAMARDIDPLKYELARQKLQNSMFLTSENLKRLEATTAERGQQVGGDIYRYRGTSAASGATTSPGTQANIAKMYTKLVDMNRSLEAARQKAYIQNALANQQQNLAAHQYLFQTALTNAQAGDLGNINNPGTPGQMFG